MARRFGTGFGGVWRVAMLGLVGMACGGGVVAAPVAAPAAPLLVPPLPEVKAAVAGAYGELKGQVELRRAGRPYWEKAVKGAPMQVGDWVRTGTGGAVQLVFTAGAKLDVEESALVVVEEPEAPAEAGQAALPAVAVTKGVVRSAAGTEADQPIAALVLKSGGRTQRVTARAGGTKVDYRVRATDSGLEISATQGNAVVEQGTEKVDLQQGRATVASETLSGPIELPDFPVSVAPGIDARAFFPLKEPLVLTWKPVAGAVGYRLQLAHDLSFSVDASTLDVAGTSFDLAPTSKGLYVWRVATRGKGGVVGEFGFARRIYVEAEAPRELLLTPEDGEVIGFAKELPTITFQWQAAAGAQSYRLHVSRTMDPQAKPIVTETTDAQRLEVKKLGPGEYWWGIYVRPGMQPIFLTPHKLVIKQMNKPKVDAPKSIGWE